MTLYFCTAILNRWSTFKHLLSSFEKMNDSDSVMCLYDWNSTDIDLKAQLAAAKINYVYGKHDIAEPINRAAARNKAFSLSNAKTDDIIFFVDCDMVLPEDFALRVKKTVAVGTAYFPVCYSLYKNRPREINGSGPQHSPGRSTANGWWRYAGRGNCGFVVKDFCGIGGWNVSYGARYGKEDDDIFTKSNKLLKVVREEVPGFFHLWHPKLSEPINHSRRRGHK